METEFQSLLAELVSPMVITLIGLMVTLGLKDIASSLVKGLTFRLNPLFNEGDTVLIDDEYAVIVSIGIRNSIFGIMKPDGNYIWRYVLNEEIHNLKIEKVVRTASAPKNKDPQYIMQIKKILMNSHK